MSYVKDNTVLHELEEDIFWHSEEAKFHFQQYKNHCQEAQHHFKKHLEHHQISTSIFARDGEVLHVS